MVFVVETSRGKLALQFSYASKRLGPGIRVFEFAEDGWASELDDGWSAHKSKQGEFPEFLAKVTGMPKDEAERLSNWALAAWRERSGDESALKGKEDIWTFLQIFRSFLVVLFIPLALVAFLVWLVVNIF